MEGDNGGKAMMDGRAMELRVNECVKKLSARETHKQGVAELLEVIEHHVVDEASLLHMLRALSMEMAQSLDYPQSARVELVSLYGLLGEMFGASLGAANVPRMVHVLCDRLKVDNDVKVVQAIAEAMATICAGVRCLRSVFLLLSF